MAPERSISRLSKSSSTVCRGASNESSAIARRNSFFEICPSPLVSHSRKRLITFCRWLFITPRSCLSASDPAWITTLGGRAAPVALVAWARSLVLTARRRPPSCASSKLSWRFNSAKVTVPLPSLSRAANAASRAWSLHPNAGSLRLRTAARHSEASMQPLASLSQRSKIVARLWGALASSSSSDTRMCSFWYSRASTKPLPSLSS